MPSACVLIRKMPGGPSKPVKILIPFVSQNRHRRIEEFLSLRRLRADPPQPRVVFLRKIGGAREDEDLAKSQLALPRPGRSPGCESPGHEDRGPVSFRRLNSRANNFVPAVKAAVSKPTSKTLVGVGGREPKKQTSTTVTGKTVFFAPRFRTRGQRSAVLSRDPNTGSSKTDHQRSIIINLIQSNPDPGSDRISYPILGIPEAARTIIAYPIWT